MNPASTALGRLIFVILAFVLFFVSPFPRSVVFAAVSSCTASVSPSTVTRSTSSNFSFRIDNTSAQTITWVKATAPSGNFTITGASTTGWSSSITDSDITLTEGSLTPATGFMAFYVNATSGSTDAGSADWTVLVSDDSGGASPTACTGSLGTAISGEAPPESDTTGPTLSDLIVSDVTDSSVKITWTTDESSSTSVEYGTDDSYGTSASGGSTTTSHSVSITGLSANTTYHYDAKSADSVGNVGESGDNTFVTAKTGQTGTTVTGTVTTTTSTGVKATPTPVPDTAGPYVVIASKFDKAFTQAPAIKGTATDKSLVASLEYSTDDGHNWLPVDFIDKINTTRTEFSFTPQLLDGNYMLKIRAKDGKGNTSTTDGGTLVVDRLPPRIGGVVFSLGPQELIPAANGSYIVPSGLDYKITLSAVGGPLNIDISYADSDGNVQKTSLKKNPDNGLWSAFLRFEHPGDYTLIVDSKDGADNAIHQEFTGVTVLSSGVVLDGATPIRNGRVEAYYLDDATKRFVLWDGSAYGQDNPQKLTSSGGYRLYLPAGTYYLRIAAPGYKTIVTSIFTITRAYPIVSNFVMIRARAIRFGPWLIPLPDFRQTTSAINIGIPASASRSVIPAAVNAEFPYFRLDADGGVITSNTLRGKPTLIVFLNTWLPQASAQLAVLTDVAKKTEIQVVAIMPQETASSVLIFKKRAGYTFPIAADPDGDLVETLGLHTLPSHIIVNRKGIVQSIQTGLYDKEQLFDMIVK